MHHWNLPHHLCINRHFSIEPVCAAFLWVFSFTCSLKKPLGISVTVICRPDVLTVTSNQQCHCTEGHWEYWPQQARSAFLHLKEESLPPLHRLSDAFEAYVELQSPVLTSDVYCSSHVSIVVRFLESHWFVWATQMSHLPMPIDYDTHDDWVTTQLRASRNVDHSLFNDWWSGHLNFQIEHQSVIHYSVLAVCSIPNYLFNAACNYHFQILFNWPFCRLSLINLLFCQTNGIRALKRTQTGLKFKTGNLQKVHVINIWLRLLLTRRSQIDVTRLWWIVLYWSSRHLAWSHGVRHHPIHRTYSRIRQDSCAPWGLRAVRIVWIHYQARYKQTKLVFSFITHAGCIAAVMGRAFSRVCLFVLSLKGKRLGPLTPNLVHIYPIVVSCHALTQRSKGHHHSRTVASNACCYGHVLLLLAWICMLIWLPMFSS